MFFIAAYPVWFLKIAFILANSADPDEVLLNFLLK